MKSISIKDYLQFKTKSNEKNHNTILQRNLPPRSNSKPKPTTHSIKITPITNLHPKKLNNIPKPPQPKPKPEIDSFSNTFNLKRNYVSLFESMTIKPNKRINNSTNNSKPKDHKCKYSPNSIPKKPNRRIGRPAKSPVPIDNKINSYNAITSIEKHKRNTKQKSFHTLCLSKSKEKITNPISLLHSHLVNTSQGKKPKSKSPSYDKGKVFSNCKIKHKKYVNDGIHLFFNKLQQLHTTSHSRSTSANTTMRLSSNNNRNKHNRNVIHKLKANINYNIKRKEEERHYVKYKSPHSRITTKEVVLNVKIGELSDSNFHSPERSIHDDNIHEIGNENNDIQYNVHNDTICSQEEEIVPIISKHIKNIYEFSHVGYDGDKNKDNNQDSYVIKKNFIYKTNYIFFSICDGHGVEGHFVSSFICDILPLEMSERLRHIKIESISLNDNSNILHKVITNAFLTTNDKLIHQEGINSLFSGTTCVSVIYTPSKLITAHVGDSRAVLGRYDSVNNKWVHIVLTRDHKPTEPDEMERILKNGGRIQPFYEEGVPYGPMRVWVKDDDYPGLAMTRSFGDRVAATVGVVSEPEINEIDLHKDDKFMVIASDGIWEFISNEECVDIVKDFYMKGDGNGCINKLYELSRNRWLKEEDVVDDTTVILVFFE